MLKEYKNIYFLGIGGVGMSGVAGWCHEKGFNVSGYDRDDNYFTLKLKLKGVLIHHNSSIKEISKDFLDNKNVLIVYTPAIKNNHSLYTFFRSQNFKIIKRSEFLREICLEYVVIAISGTHGKTTISIMLSHLLMNAGYSPSAFFGGISKNYDTNFLIGNSHYMIVEADEYDESFLQLNPTISVVTSMDKDHTDTYKSENDMIEAYYQFYVNTSNSHQKFQNKFFISSDVSKKFHTHLEHRNEFGYKGVTVSKLLINKIKFEQNYDFLFKKNMCEHNINNALIAIKISESIGLSRLQIEKGFQKYEGIKRRFEYHINKKNLILIDDYAHHPEELNALIKSVRKLYPNKELFLIFQPHLFSRTKDLEKDFCRVLGLADKIGLLDIYPAREEPIEGVSTKNLLKKIKLQNKWHLNLDNICNVLSKESPNLIVTAGAGDIYKLIPIIKSILL